MEYEEILGKLRSLANPEAVAGMARYGINPENTYGVSIPNLRMIAKETGANHILAQRLWSSGVHEARILASLIDDPNAVTEQQMDAWVKDVDSWDVCDQCCNNLFSKTKFAYQKAREWSRRRGEFVKRAGFVLVSSLAVHDRKRDDRVFEEFLQIVKSEATDDRNYVRKAVNWALRQIGKRNTDLNAKAIMTAKEIQKLDTRAAKWIAYNALRELMSEKIKKRLRRN